jgi:serine/threonine-protein kinase
LHAKLSNNGRWLKPEDLNDTGIILPVNNPEYISPEEAADLPLTPFSDQYSLGILAYELLAGQTPFHDGSVVTIYRKHKDQAPAPPSAFNGDLTVAIDEAVLRALQKSPSSRYENCSQFARALRAAVEVMAEKEFNLFLEQARIAMEIGDVEAGISALDGAIRIKPNSIEVKSLTHSLKNLERATNFYKEACDSFVKAQQMARSIREEEPDYPDKDHLLTKLVPPPVSFLKIIRKNSRVALMTFFISIGFAVVAGMATIIYSETAGSQTFRPTIVAIDRTSTPTFAPATPYTLTPAATP